MFIGYQRSSHSLVGALLDAHPEIIIPHEYDVMAKIGKYQSSEHKQNKYALFYALHHLSMAQARSGIRASTNKSTPTGKITKYTYHVPGLWQGSYQKRIKVTYNLMNNVLCLYNRNAIKDNCTGIGIPHSKTS